MATIPVSDLEQARTFYSGTLGLTQLWENPASIRFRAGDVSELSVFPSPGTETQHTVAHFEVADIEATVRDLEARGVTFVDYTEGPLVTTGHIAQWVRPAAPGSRTPTATSSASDKASPAHPSSHHQGRRPFEAS